MKITIQSRGFSLTPALKNFVEERLCLVLARFESRVTRVEVMLLDINGPRGGLWIHGKR